MPLVQTRGAASAQGFGEFAQVTAANYVEDVFSCFLYTGNGSTQTITNGIDLSTKGGLVWTKNRNSGPNSHLLYDTNRGTGRYVSSDTTNAEIINATTLTSFNSNGFSLGVNASYNGSSTNYVSWTFRKQPKFFDVVTYTGNATNRTIAHALGSVPACIMVKRTDTTADWAVYHRSLANTQYLVLNSTAAAATGATWWNSTTPTSSVFSLGTDATVNASGGTYVAYLFAHDAGGFGLAGTDNVISCGSASTDASGNWTATLGYEPQWILWRNPNGVAQWEIADTMRGASYADTLRLFPNLSNAEDSASSAYIVPNATGFSGVNGAGPANGTIIYITIRRGPMKVPTTGTSVFKPNAYTGTGAVLPITGMGFPPDFLLTKARVSGNDWAAQDKLRGPSQYLSPNGTTAELNLATAQLVSIDQDGVTYGNGSSATNFNGSTYINYSFRRAPGFFDEVCWTGNGSYGYKNHNLTVVPELIISKKRSAAEDWFVWQPTSTYVGLLQVTNAFFNNGLSPATTTQFTPILDASGGTYVSYLFATCPGVSKVGTYTGNGTTQTINCGFGASGSRFVLIKRTDSTGDWYVWDSARGMVSGTDPSLLLNSTAAEVNANSVYAISTGFQIVSTAAGINASGGSYIFLSVA